MTEIKSPNQTAIDRHHLPGLVSRDVRMAILRTAVLKEPFILRDVLPQEVASQDTLRRQAKRLVDGNYLVRLPDGTYIAASAYDASIHSVKGIKEPKRLTYSQEDLLAFMKTPRDMQAIANKIGYAKKTAGNRIRPLIVAGEVHKMQVGQKWLYATSRSALEDLARARVADREAEKRAKWPKRISVMNVDQMPARNPFSPRFGSVSNIADAILRQKAVATTKTNQRDRSAA